MDVAVDSFPAMVPQKEFRSSSIAGAECVGADLPALGKAQFEEEIDALVRFFNEEEGLQGVVRCRKDRDTPAIAQRKKIATFLEGSRLPFSALVKDIYQKLSGDNDQDQSKSGAVTMASVKISVLSLGERLSFGITNPDADVLEDDNTGSLWCWEVRDVKLLSKVSRDEILDRRRWRKKIGERIDALSATIDALRSECGESGQAARVKAAREALAKTDDQSAIRTAKLLWQQKKEAGISARANPDAVQKNPVGEQPNNLTHQEATASKGRRKSDPEEKERLRQEKLLKRKLAGHEKEQKRKDKEEADRKKQQQKLQDEAEKEQKRKDKEEADRKKQQQKLQDEAEKEQKRKDKEEGERRKQEKRLQDEADRDQKREAERKKQLALKKQASFMDRFLVKKDAQQAKDQTGCGEGQPQPQSDAQDASSLSPVAAELQKRESVSPILQAAQKTAALVARMDVELRNGGVVAPDARELLRSHVNSWLSIRNECKLRKNHRWGVRRKPKVSVFRELRLSGGTTADSRGNSQDDSPLRKGPAVNSNSPASHLKRSREDFCTPETFIDLTEDAVDECCPNSPQDEGKKSSSSSSSRYHRLRNKKRKLLQFDKSHRPPYYGTFRKKSKYIKPRNPLKPDPALDYEVDSDEEWEEEDPGESLSDTEKDEEDEKGEIESIEDEEDDFVVPDGYLSENEGVAMEDAERGVAVAGGSSATQSPVTPVRQTVMTMERLRKVLDNATEHAIRSNHPLVISNLGQLPGCEEDAPSQFPSNRTETMCLEALRMRVLVPNLVVGAC